MRSQRGLPEKRRRATARFAGALERKVVYGGALPALASRACAWT